MIGVHAFPTEPRVDEALALAHKLTREEYARLVRALGRVPTYPELGAVGVLWSEHCSYKSSRVHLTKLPTTGPRVLVGPGENAGVVDLGDGVAAVFKVESHNHPSFIEPFHGAATGVGGILRDVFTMGARPIACLNSLRFGRPDHPRTAELLRGVVAGIGAYGNRVGVPTVGGELSFDRAYDANILVNAFACGIVRADRITLGRACGPGNLVLYVGASTGRDGIHGATMASDAFDAASTAARPTVQVGDPFLEKLLIEACLSLHAEGLLVGMQDMGAAGLTSSSVEMASRAGTGLELDLDAVPRRARGLSPYELLLSESQERMLLVCVPENEARVRSVCEKWELDVAVIGRVTDTGRWVVRATPGFDPLAEPTPRGESQIVCDLPVALLVSDAPRYGRPQAEDPARSSRLAFEHGEPSDEVSWSETLLQLLGSPNLGSKAWVHRQYDSTVGGSTIVGPGSDAAVVRARCDTARGRVEKLLAFAIDGNSALCELEPRGGAAMAVAEVCRNLVCSGAEPLGLTDGLNFGSPKQPHVMWQLAQAVAGIAEACEALAVPIVSGNVSLYNETDGRAIPPTPILAGVGLVRELRDVTRSCFPEPGLDVVLIAPRDALAGPLGGSAYVAVRTGEVQGCPPQVDLVTEAALQRMLLDAIRGEPRLVLGAHDVADGGLAVALAECCASDDPSERGVGAEVVLPPSTESLAERLFGEAPSRVVVTVAPGELEVLSRRAAASGLAAFHLGVTGGDRLVVRDERARAIDVEVAAIRTRRQRALEGIVGLG